MCKNHYNKCIRRWGFCYQFSSLYLKQISKIMIQTYSCLVRIADRLHFTVFWKSGSTVRYLSPWTLVIDWNLLLPCGQKSDAHFSICVCVQIVQHKELAISRGKFPPSVKQNFSIKFFFSGLSSCISFLIPQNKFPQSNVLISLINFFSSLLLPQLPLNFSPKSLLSFANLLLSLTIHCSTSKEKMHTVREYILSPRYYGLILSSFQPLKSIPDLSNPENQNIYLRTNG